MPKKEDVTQFEPQVESTPEVKKKRYRVLKAPVPLVVQEKILMTGIEVELEETPQVLSLVEQKILKEV